MPAHLSPIETPATTTLLTGDPRRAFALAGELMEQPRMSHLERGLWGYTGTTVGGMELTVQSTGSGGPAAAAVLGDLTELGVERVVRVGTCLAELDPVAASAILVERAVCRDGTSLLLGDGDGTALPDPGLNRLLSGIASRGIVSSHDLVARLDPTGSGPAEGAIARDLQTAAVFALSAKLGVEAAAVLVVAGDGSGIRLDEARLSGTFLELGRNIIRRLEET